MIMGVVKEEEEEEGDRRLWLPLAISWPMVIELKMSPEKEDEDEEVERGWLQAFT